VNRQLGGNMGEMASWYPRQRRDRFHSSPGTENGIAPSQELGPEGIEARGVRLLPSPDDQIPGRLPGLYLLTPDFPQLSPQTIAGHRGSLKLGDDESHPWLARWVVHPDHIEMLETPAAAMGEAAANV
jgi:hypothetical protein